MTSGYYYLALPYQGSPEDQADRESLSLKTALDFLDQGIYLFSPVTYISTLVKGMNSPSLEKRRDLLMPYVLQFLKVSKGLVLFKAAGWQKSWGVNQELLFCKAQNIPVFIMEEKEPRSLEEILSIPLSEGQLASLIQENKATNV